MKLLLINYEFWPIGGGAGMATYSIAKELVKLGHTVDVLTTGKNGNGEVQNLNGFDVYRVHTWRKGIHDCGFRGALTFLSSAALRLRQLVQEKKYDLIHYFFSFPTCFLTLFPGNHRKTPYILSLRGSDVPHYDEYHRTLQYLHFVLKPINRMLWRRAKKVVALSESLKEIANRTEPCQDIEIIPNGVDTKLFCINRNQKVSDGIFRLITVSRLVKRKGIQNLLQAIKNLQDPSIQLLIVGSGNYEHQLKNLSQELALNGQVKFFGFCHCNQLPRLYNQSDVFILPSLAESFGLVFLEAMACGLPIIGAHTGGIPDIVQDENGILVTPESISEIQAAILKMRDSQQLRTDMGNRNRQRVIKHYSWQRVAEEYQKIYLSCNYLAFQKNLYALPFPT